MDIVGASHLYELATVAALHALLFVYVIVNFFLATFVDPGRYPKQAGLVELSTVAAETTKTNYKNLLINDINVRMKWCSTCQFYRPPRSSHCSVCNACIDVC